MTCYVLCELTVGESIVKSAYKTWHPKPWAATCVAAPRAPQGVNVFFVDSIMVHKPQIMINI